MSDYDNDYLDDMGEEVNETPESRTRDKSKFKSKPKERSNKKVKRLKPKKTFNFKKNFKTNTKSGDTVIIKDAGGGRLKGSTIFTAIIVILFILVGAYTYWYFSMVSSYGTRIANDLFKYQTIQQLYEHQSDFESITTKQVYDQNTPQNRANFYKIYSNFGDYPTSYQIVGQGYGWIKISIVNKALYAGNTIVLTYNVSPLGKVTNFNMDDVLNMNH